MKDAEHRVLDSGLNLSVVRRSCPVSHFQLYTPFGGDVLQYRDPSTGKDVSLQPGSAHYFEHVLFIMPPLGKDGKPIKRRTNTPKRKKNLRDGMTELENNGAIIANAYTGADHTNYWFATRLNPLENLETMLDFVFTAYLPQDRFRKERGTIGDEIARAENDSARLLYQGWNEQAYVRHGGRFSIVGTKKTIAEIKLEDVLSMHDTFYRPSNMGLVAVGDIDTDAVAGVVARTLERLGKGEYLPPPGEVSQNEPKGVVRADNFDDPLRRPDVMRPTVLGGWKYLVEPSEMTPEELIDLHIAGDIVAYALFGEGSKSRERLIRAGMDEGTFEGHNLDFRDRGCIQVAGDTDEPERFRCLIQECSTDALARGLPQEEIEYAKNALLTDADGAAESVLGFGGRLAGWGALTRNPFDYFRAVERLENMTPEEVNALLPKLLAPENLTFCLMVPE